MEGINKAKGSKTIDSFGERVVDHALLAPGAEAQELEARSMPLDDFGGDGIPIILRRFQFQLPPKVRYTAKELLKQHTPRINLFLWKDGLEQIREPKVVMGKQGKFDIFATCQPRKGHLLHERPKTLTQTINENARANSN